MVRIEKGAPLPQDGGKASQVKTSSTQPLTGRTFEKLNSKENALPEGVTDRIPSLDTKATLQGRVTPRGKQ